ncbi:MAG TPA: hypothetical protein VK826_00080 [Bacteroidia bacterium]|nr:hypothetical protein [Bacteroidia bacterium]
MSQQDTIKIPPGTLFFHDHFIPALEAGNWRIHVEQFVEKDGAALNIDKDKQTIPLNAEQEFIVSAPQFSLPPGAVAAQFPPDSSSGAYRDVLPHIVLEDPLLPWERKFDSKLRNRPWLALLVFTDEELNGAEDVATRSAITTVDSFLQPQTGVLKTSVAREADIPGDTPCSFIRVPVKTFSELVPLVDELELLAHCRKVNMEDKAENSGDGFFSVVVANRFPATDDKKPKKNIVHLVSLEGLSSWLTAKPDFKDYTEVALVSLASWTFSVLPANHEDFRGLVNRLVQSVNAEGQSLLRLPFKANSNGDASTLKRVEEGFIPLVYHTRTGEETPAWYRGPFVPVAPAVLKKEQPFLTADSALIYDKSQGVFDLSLSSAWTLGRATALADKNFSQHLYELRRKAHRTTDLMLHRQSSSYFSSDESSIDHAAQNEFEKIMGDHFLKQIGEHVSVAEKTGVEKKKTVAASKPAVQLSAFLENKQVQQRITTLVDETDKEVSQWLARLSLLYPVPFNYLVPDEKMLSEESLRFFYIDANWIGALIDGALSIGLESSRDTKLHTLIHGTLQKNAMIKAASWRAGLLGKTVSTTDEPRQASPVCGLLLRSALVSGWPGLAVRALNNNGTPVNTLRLERISSGVLLCLFDAVPDYFEIAEPYEGLRFGTDDDGSIPLRNFTPPAKPGDPEIGEQLKGNPVLKLRDLSGKESLCMRDKGSRSLRLTASEQSSLSSQLQASNKTIQLVTPGSLAMQMVKSPEAIRIFSLNKKSS